MRQAILEVLRQEGRSLVWLGRKTKYNANYLSQVFNGHSPSTPQLRAACALALGVDESLLFHASPTNEPATEKVA